MGTEEFVFEFVQAKVEAVKLKMLPLPQLHPQHALRLLLVCINPALLFLSQVTPPSQCLPALAEFDSFRELIVQRILTLPDHPEPPECTPERLRLAMVKLSLPVALHGAGVLPMRRQAPLAYWASVVASTRADEELAAHSAGIMRFAAGAHALILPLLGAKCRSNAYAYSVLPAEDADRLLDNAFYNDIFNQSPSLRLLRVLSKAASRSARAEMLKEVAEHKAAHPSDYVAAFSKSQSSRVLMANLAQRRNRLDPPQFVSWMRFFLRLPQLPHLAGPAVVTEQGYKAEVCLSGHAQGERALLDTCMAITRTVNARLR